MFPRYLLARRVWIQHLRRVCYNMEQQKGMDVETRTIIKDLMQGLGSFSIDSSYAHVRKTAQSVLSSCIKMHPTYRSVLLPKLIGALKPAEKSLNSKIADTKRADMKEAHASYIVGIF